MIPYIVFQLVNVVSVLIEVSVHLKLKEHSLSIAELVMNFQHCKLLSVTG